MNLKLIPEYDLKELLSLGYTKSYDVLNYKRKIYYKLFTKNRCDIEVLIDSKTREIRILKHIRKNKKVINITSKNKYIRDLIKNNLIAQDIYFRR